MQVMIPTTEDCVKQVGSERMVAVKKLFCCEYSRIHFIQGKKGYAIKYPEQ